MPQFCTALRTLRVQRPLYRLLTARIASRSAAKGPSHDPTETHRKQTPGPAHPHMRVQAEEQREINVVQVFNQQSSLRPRVICHARIRKT